MRGLALRILLANTITSIDHFIELLVTLEERVAVLPCKSLNCSKYRSKIGINSFR